MLRASTSYGATNIVVAAIPANLVKVQGYWRGGDAYLQIFDATSLPANATVPLKSFPIQGNFAFAWNFGGEALEELPLSTGCVIAISSTAASLTIAVGSTADFMIDTEEYEVQVTGLTDVTAAAADSVEVWSDAIGNNDNVLYKVVVVNAEGADLYLQLFAKAPTTGDRNIGEWKVLSATTRTLRFGSGGRTFISSQDANGTLHWGCELYMSTTPKTFTAAAGAGCTLTGSYK